MRHQERGLSIWPFVICLVLMLVFGFLWFSEKSKAEELVKQKDDAIKQREEMAAKAGEIGDYAEKISAAVGYQTKTVGGKNLTDVDALLKDLDPEQAGATGALRAAAKVKTVKNVFTAAPGGVAAKDAAVVKLTQEFADKLAATRAAHPGELAALPDDPDDAPAMAKWQADKAAWDAKYTAYVGMLSDLTKQAEWPAYKAGIGAYGLFAADEVQWSDWDYWRTPPGATLTVQDVLAIPAPIVKALAESHKLRVEGYLQTQKSLQAEIAKLTAQITSADAAAPGLDAQLTALRTELADTTAKLQKESQDARGQLESERVKSTTAENQLEKEKQDHKGEVTGLTQKLDAEVAARLVAKQKADIVITRDDPDGEILAADNNLGTCYTNLGFADKAYAGLKLRVTYNARGAIRTTKGEIVIIKVLDSHYSQARIASLVDGERPIGRGDMVSNPFFDKTKQIHVFIAGALRKYPKAIAVERLKALGAVVQDAIDNQTDFVVIPDSISAKPEAPAAGAEAPAPGAQTDYDKLVAMARNFGANLITEKLLEAYLEY